MKKYSSIHVLQFTDQKLKFVFLSPWTTVPEISWAGVYGECLLIFQIQALVMGLDLYLSSNNHIYWGISPMEWSVFFISLFYILLLSFIK